MPQGLSKTLVPRRGIEPEKYRAATRLKTFANLLSLSPKILEFVPLICAPIWTPQNNVGRPMQDKHGVKKRPQSFQRQTAITSNVQDRFRMLINLSLCSHISVNHNP
jgi:hypothetical protein